MVRTGPPANRYVNRLLPSDMVLNFDVYHPVQVVHIDPRGYQYADHPLPGNTSVLTGTKAYQPVPPRISTVTEANRSIRSGMVGENIFKILGCTIDTP